jgi:hypothetical protein
MEPELGRDGVALRIKIRGEDARSGAAGERCEHQADGTLADDQHRFVGGKVEQLDAFEDGIHRLDERGLLKGNAVRES